jgi:hypothetical protein
MTKSNQATALRVRRASEIAATGDLAIAGLDRYLVDSSDSGGLVAVVEHVLAPGALAAPVHQHSREDEYSVVLEGRLGVFQDDEEWSPLLGTLCSSHAGTGTHSGTPEMDSCACWR